MRAGKAAGKVGTSESKVPRWGMAEPVIGTLAECDPKTAPDSLKDGEKP